MVKRMQARILRRVAPHERHVLAGDARDEWIDVAHDDAAHVGEPQRLARAVPSVREILSASALTLNPLSGIRGSSVKVVESLAAGRACVSTEDGARGFSDAGLRGLITVPDVRAMIGPIIDLLEDPERRRRIEAPDLSRLSRFRWQHCAGIQGDLYRNLLAGGSA